MGIVPTNDPAPMFRNNVPTSVPESSSESASTTSSSNSEDGHDDPAAADEGDNYINEEFHRARGPAKIKHVSAGALFNHMIRSSLRKGHKWIFVADTSFRLYIGYKQAGAFQHSSFLSGSRILAAGQIKVKKGQLRRLSPLSGHYRSHAANFKAFVNHAKESGVDMSRVSISRSYAVLVGIEGYSKGRKKIKDAEATVSHQKDKVLDPEKVVEVEKAEMDKSKSAAKEREYLEQQRLQAEKAVGGCQREQKNDEEEGSQPVSTEIKDER